MLLQGRSDPGAACLQLLESWIKINWNESSQRDLIGQWKFNLLQSLLDPLRLPRGEAACVLVTGQAERG